MVASTYLLLSQMPPAPPTGWERVGIVTLLVVAIFVIGLAFFRPWVVVIQQYTEKAEECEKYRAMSEHERQRADMAEEKYVNSLKEDLKDWKQRDQTIALLSKAASRNNRGAFNEDST